MKRNLTTVRPDWEKIVSQQGLVYYRTPSGPYWNESAYYSFSAQEIDDIETATNTLHEMCLAAGQYIIDHNLFDRFAIPPQIANLIVKTWNDEPPAIYGRFDLAYDGKQIKMLEYNADTPTSLIEAAVIQWYWLEDRFPDADQFNSIHDKLIAKWKELLQYTDSPLYFAYIPDNTGEDLMTITYMQDTANQAGHKTKLLTMQEMGFCNECREFADREDYSVGSVFKLYPWEWMINEEFGKHLPETYDKTDWIEPIWKMMWSNKALLPVLWEMYPNHPLLLAAYHENDPKAASLKSKVHVRKPLLSREGANITLCYEGGSPAIVTGGEYGEEGYIIQDMASLPNFDGQTPVIGSWVIDGVAAGIGIRESSTPITDNTSCFVPHIFE